jgi:hypothetical protein
MPLKYWDEAFLTATYLINRLPSRVIQGDTPYHRVFKEEPNYNFLRAFGCACWPNLRPYNSHKLQFHFKQCVFMGYSTLHKGYKCLDLSTGQIYTSRDVVFDELVFPFSALNPNAGPTLRAEAALHPTLFPDLSMGSQLTGDHVANFPLASDPVCSSHSMQQPQVNTEDPEPRYDVQTGDRVPESASDHVPIIGNQGAQQSVAWQQRQSIARSQSARSRLRFPQQMRVWFCTRSCATAGILCG